MTESQNNQVTVEVDLMQSSPSSPLVFISHDTRDAELAGAFSKLLTSVSAGMIKTFRSSDKKGTEGINFGDEWYKRLMTQLQSTTDVVCLFTERSLDRPWILFEAGVAKGRLDTPVIGVALGVPLGRVGIGPFYQFQNMDDSDDALTKLVNQLAERVPNLKLDSDVVMNQVATFKITEAVLLKGLASGTAKAETKEEKDERAIAKLAEEMKVLPSRVAERLAEGGEPSRRRRSRYISPVVFDEFLFLIRGSEDPVSILFVASLVRDDSPWFYEVAIEAYRAVKTGNADAIRSALKSIHELSNIIIQRSSKELFGFDETDFSASDFSVLIERLLIRFLETNEAQPIAQKSRRVFGDRRPMSGDAPRNDTHLPI